MFGGLTSKIASTADEVAGTGNNCRLISLEIFKSDPAFGFLSTLEIPFIIYRSRSITYVFTDIAIIRIVAEGGAKKVVFRYEYARFDISNVTFQTANNSMTDQDCELSFNVGQLQITIEIAKDEQEKAIQVYRTLVHLSMVQQQNLRLLNFSKALPPININCAGGQDPVTLPTSVLSNWVNHALNTWDPVSFKWLFEANGWTAHP